MHLTTATTIPVHFDALQVYLVLVLAGRDFFNTCTLAGSDAVHDLHQVANLFARDEMDEILGALVPLMKKEFPKRPPSNENLKEYYLFRVRINLHVALCFSPVRWACCVGMCVAVSKSH